MMKHKQAIKIEIAFLLSRNIKAKLRMNSKIAHCDKNIGIRDVGAFLRIRIMHTHSTHAHTHMHTHTNTCMIGILMFIFQFSALFDYVYYFLYLILAKPLQTHLCVESANCDSLLWILCFGDFTHFADYYRTSMYA